jgi:short-subunit dehydrogenase
LAADEFMTTQTQLHVLLLGAASGIAQATARLYAAEGAVIGLAGRNAERLTSIANDLKARGASRVETFEIDLAVAEPSGTLASMAAGLGRADHVILAYGALGDQALAEHDLVAAQSLIDVNFRSAAGWALAIANMLERQGQGSLVVLGSVAGDRGRRSNYIYGAAKAGLAVLVQGISHRFHRTGPRAVIVKPGPTDTAMTAGMTKGGPLWSTPEAVAAVVRKSADSGGPVVYAPARWRLIMMIIRAIPAVVFNKMNF